MKRFGTWTVLSASAALLLAACGDSHHGPMSVNVGTDKGNISMKHRNIQITANDHPDAAVTPAGKLLIDDKVVELGESDRALAQAYFQAGRAFNAQVLHMGKLGIQLAAHSAGQVISGLLDGTADKAADKAASEALALTQKAKVACLNFDQWRQAQDALATAVPAFKPYALIQEKDIQKCYEDLSDHDRDTGADSNDDDSDAAAPAPPSPPTPPSPPSPPSPPAHAAPPGKPI